MITQMNTDNTKNGVMINTDKKYRYLLSVFIKREVFTRYLC